MGYVHILLVVCGITATALVAKLAALRKVSALDLATSLFGVSTILGLLVLWWQAPITWDSHTVVVSSIAGVGGALAVLIFNAALKAGHFGFSNAIYRSSFLIPTVYAVLFMGAALHWVTALGILVISIAIFLMSWPTAEKAHTGQVNFRWLILILSAFLLSGAPRVGQALTSAHHDNIFVYLFLSYLTGAIVLVIMTLVRRSFDTRSLGWGTLGAVASYIGVFCTLKALACLSPQTVFPITLSGPIILGVLLSLFFFRERIRLLGWLGIGLGVTGITILAIWK